MDSESVPDALDRLLTGSVGEGSDVRIADMIHEMTLALWGIKYSLDRIDDWTRGIAEGQ
jgi:hypothetical protein